MTNELKDMDQRLLRLAESRNSRFWRVDFDALSPSEQVFRMIWELEAEVNNGGFRQYFSNTSGRRVPDVAGALRIIGAAAMSRIVEQAIEIAGRDVAWSDDGIREEAMAALDPQTVAKLDEYDRAFFAYPDNLTLLLYNYVREHRSEMNAPAEF